MTVSREMMYTLRTSSLCKKEGKLNGAQMKFMLLQMFKISIYRTYIM